MEQEFPRLVACLKRRQSFFSLETINSLVGPGGPKGQSPQTSDDFFVLQKQILGQTGRLIGLCKCKKAFGFKGFAFPALDPAGGSFHR